jgi:hypothetical protein
MLNISKNNEISDFDFLCGSSHNLLMGSVFKAGVDVKNEICRQA